MLGIVFEIIFVQLGNSQAKEDSQGCEKRNRPVPFFFWLARVSLLWPCLGQSFTVFLENSLK